MRLSIEYCVTCNYRPIAASMAIVVKGATGIETDLVASSQMGAFEVSLDGELIFSKVKTSKFPDKEEILKLINERGIK